MILTTNILFYFLLFSYSFFFIQGKIIMSNILISVTNQKQMDGWTFALSLQFYFIQTWFRFNY